MGMVWSMVGAGGQVLHVFPAGVAVVRLAVGGGDDGGGFLAGAFARQADADEAFGIGEDDAAVEVVPGVALVLLHHRELHAVDQQ